MKSISGLHRSLKITPLSSTTHTTDAKDKRADLDRGLDQLSRRGSGAHDMFCDGSLQGRAAQAARAGAAQLQDTVNFQLLVY